mgnify:CR=1 FL=1
MDITSEPAYIEETVTNIDLAFLSGVVPLTIRPANGDTIVENPDTLIITVADPPEVITVQKPNLLWRGVRKQTIRRLIKGAPTHQSPQSPESPQPPVATGPTNHPSD